MLNFLEEITTMFLYTIPCLSPTANKSLSWIISSSSQQNIVRSRYTTVYELDKHYTDMMFFYNVPYGKNDEKKIAKDTPKFILYLASWACLIYYTCNWVLAPPSCIGYRGR